jgi:hypothetical protein
MQLTRFAAVSEIRTRDRHSESPAEVLAAFM